MRKLIRSVLIICACVTWAAIPKYAFAGIDRAETSINGPFANNAFVETKDDKFQKAGFNWASVVNRSVQNTITLRVIDNVLINYTFTYTVNLKIDYYTDPAQATPTTVNTSLTVNYSPGQGTTYKGLDTYNFTGAYRVIVTVTSTSGAPPQAGMVSLTNRIEVDRSYEFQPHAAIGAVYTQPSNRQLKVSFTNAQNVDEFDIEWTTINDGNPGYGVISVAGTYTAGSPIISALDQAFRNNASRVTLVKDVGYTIPLITSDYLVLVRIRQAQYNAAGVRVTGDWDYKNGLNYAIWTVVPNEATLNWQYSAAYAEEGKKKEVISYFDGSLRGRQTMTLNNSDNVLVAQENVYDAFGRVIASVLPAPDAPVATGTVPYLHYISNFNLKNATTPYSYTDIAGSGGTFCELNPSPMSISGGAAKYYSSANTFRPTRPENNYVPDAGGYPFSVTQYTNDNTGRIKIQGGVGPAFQPGKAVSPDPSHVTKYYYGKPEQWELDQLFGNDAGYAEHYLKNMVIDPNGQISISYLNASGKTIATALTGELPSAVDALPSYQPINAQTRKQTVKLMKPEQFVYNGSSQKLSATSTYLASVIGNTMLKFDIQKLVSNYPGVFSICSNCYYNMTIRVTDDCNNVVGGTTNNPVHIGSEIPNCADTPLYQDSLQVPIDHIGEYNVYIEFAFDNAVIERFTDNFITQGLQNNYLEKQFDYIKARYLATLDVSGCYSDCPSCSALGEQSDFVQMLTDKFVAMEVERGTNFTAWANAFYLDLKQKCADKLASCTYSPCDQVRNEMLEDVAPGGQYALFNAAGAPLEPEINVIVGTGSIQNWRIQFPEKASTDPVYQSELITRDNGSTTSPYDADFSVKELIAYWKPEWALKFLDYHPEKCQLEYCEEYNAPYKSWDMFLQEQVNSSSAVASIPSSTPLTYDASNPVDWLLNADPYFTLPSSPGYGYFSQMHNDLAAFSTKIGAINAGLNVKSLAQFVDYQLYCMDTQGTTTNTSPVAPNSSDAWNNCTPNPTCRVPDREWLMYRDYYIELKEKIYTQLAKQHCGQYCPVGQKLAFQLPGACPVAADFSLRAYTGASPACTGSQTILLTRDAGAVGQSVTVNLYYPQLVESPTLTHAITFVATESQKTFCLPDNIPLSSVLVKSVVCGSGSGGDSGENMGGAGNSVSLVDESDANSTLNPRGATSFHPRHVRIELQNSSGVLVTAPNPITVSVVIGEYTSSGTVNIPTSAVILQGQSATEIEYVGSTNNNNYGYTSGYVNCILSVVGGTLKSGLAISPCGNFTSSPYVPPVSTCPVAYASKKTRFPEVDNSFLDQVGATDKDALIAKTNADVKAQAVSACESMADTWMQRLQAGLVGKTAQQITDLRNGLIEVCAAGGDINHPFGASTVPSSTIHGYTSFGDVIKQTLPPLTYFTSTLNPWLIDAPTPYGPLQQSVVKTISNTNTAICTKLATLTQQAATAGMTLYNYLVATFPSAMTLTPGELTAIQTSCTNCKFILPQDINLPVFLDPSNSGYVTYSAYTAAKAKMNGSLGFNNNLSLSDPNYPVILSNFMNNEFGFALTYDDYIKYEASVNVGNPAPLLVNTLPYSTVPQDNYDCVKNALSVALSSGKMDYDNYIAENRRLFRENYINTCKLAKANASLTAVQQIYHYTLYYYDQADNLVRTVPPEGVTLFDSGYFKNIDLQRDNTVNPQPMNYNGPTVATPMSNALTSLSQVLSGPQGAVAMWFYNDGSATNHFVETTPDKKYIFEVSIAGTKLYVDIFPMSQSTPSSISFVPATGHYQADITAVLPLDKFVHVVLQGSSLSVPGTPELYLNGTKLTISSGPGVPSPYGFTVKAATPNVIVPDDSHYIKHMLLYDHVLTPAIIKSDASQLYFAAAELPNKGWYRFNVPNAGDPTTVNNTTNETVLYEHYNDHKLLTTYAYNSTNQVNIQQSPDGGTNKYWYDMLSRLVISQNDKQYGTITTPLNNYSFTKYDVLGRITTVGQKKQTDVNLGAPDFLPDITINQFTGAGIDTQITRTWYDQPAPVVAGNGIVALAAQNNLRKRVAASTYSDTQNGPAVRATYYDYDLDGNVETLWQQIDGLHQSSSNTDLKRIDYEYDLISGKVNFVRYQDGQPDQFYYNYIYDAENRLTEAWTGRRAIVNALQGSSLLMDHRRMDASYSYYLHGPLRRTEIGDVYGKVQGIDYAYTLQGWLKGVNSTATTAAADIGGDGAATHPTVAMDAYGYNLYYNNTDYSPILSSLAPFAKTLQTGGQLKQLFNGNIAGSSVNIPQLGTDWMDRTYRYDQLNRILNVKNYHTTDVTATPDARGDYDETFTYDGNGNILSVNRSGSGTGSQKDVMSYKYNLDANGRLTNNQLRYLNGTAAASNIAGNQADNNYKYDKIGNLVTDVQAGITGITWSVYGKIQSIAKGPTSSITYSYDVAGNRVSKTADGLTTWYVRDAQGNSLAVYDNAGGAVNWREQQLYGSSRLGMWQPNVNLSSGDPQVAWQTVGLKQYELSNHLGNVMVTLTDKRLQHTTNNTAIDYFQPDIKTAQDYYAFGGLQPGRNSSASGSYRYGFNGKENDNDVGKGDGNQQDYGMRIYDPRVGRFLSVDPITREYPALTPYQFASNTPIAAIDRDGLEGDPASIGRSVASNREYEANLYKTDPKHADAIIRQHNIDAFIFVGSMLTAGSGKLFTAFIDGIMAYGTYKTVNGIIKHDATQATEGVQLMTNAAMGEVLGFVIGRIIRSASPVILDFFGGPKSNIKGAINIDPRAISGFKGTIEDFVQVAKRNKINGKVDAIVANNPREYADYVADAALLLKKGGTLTVRGAESNRFFNQILKGTAKGLEDFEIIGSKTKISDALKQTMKSTEGNSLKGDIYEIILKKK
jgi:RHS repeat-associated protein